MSRTKRDRHVPSSNLLSTKKTILKVSPEPPESLSFTGEYPDISMSSDSWRDIRPLALGVPTRSDEFLLFEGYDSGDEYTFYRPIGGGIEFGESSEEALVREFREEVDVTVTDLRYLTTLERTFEFHNTPSHEIWFLYAVDLEELWPYEQDAFTAYEPDLDEEFPVRWLSREELQRGDVIVYPETLTELL